METKSRYEVFAQLEEQKRKYIIERDSFAGYISNKARQIKQLKRQLEDLEEERAEIISQKAEREAMLNKLIASIDKSMEDFNSGKK
jgi:hypothetical protein